jgi:DNA sulfur modification protein DndD
MKIKTIELNNFRRFFGNQIIEISSDPERNITLIHAQNGIGKTNLLNSIIWCFHGETSPNFSTPHLIVNEQSKINGNNIASVKIEFEFQNYGYLIERTHDESKPTKSRQNLTINRIDETGNLRPLPGVEAMVSQVLPRSMARNFLFDGEDATKFTSEKNSKAVSDATKDILGCDIAEAAIDDLNTIAKQFRDVAGNSNNAVINKLLLSINSLETELEHHKKHKELNENKKKDIQTRINDIDEILRGTQDTRELQLRRDDLLKQLEINKFNLQKKEQDIADWVSEFAVISVSEKLIIDSEKLLKKEEVSGKIPHQYSEPFVKNLLDTRVCVCGRDFSEHSDEEKKIIKLLDSAGSVTTANKIIQSKSRIETLKKNRSQFQIKYSKLIKEKSNLKTLVDKNEIDIGETDEKLKNVKTVEGIKEKTEKRHELVKNLEETNKDWGRINGNEDKTTIEISKKNEELKILEEKDSKQKNVLKKLHLTEDLRDHIKRELNNEQKEAVKILEKYTSETLDSVVRKDYECKIEDDFTLRLISSSGVTLPRSAGENQLLSLAFTSALIKFCKERQNIDDHDFLLKGTIAPLVLDSPFSVLDDQYRKASAKFLPEMAEQLILLITDTQVRNILDIIKDKVGKEYIMKNYSTAKTGPDDKITLNGKDYKTSFYNQEKELTQLEKING